MTEKNVHRTKFTLNRQKYKIKITFKKKINKIKKTKQTQSSSSVLIFTTILWTASLKMN